MKVEKTTESQIEELTEIQAEALSAPGAIILGATILITLILVFSLLFPSLEGMQTLIVGILVMICWGYLLNSFTEKLKLTDQSLEFTAILSRHQDIQLNEVMSFKLVDLGLSLSGDRYAFEISVIGKNKPITISLGPCWDKIKLSAFMNTFGQKLEKLD